MRRKGFTLIELTIVMAVVVVLSAMTYSAWEFSIRQSKSVAEGARLVQSYLHGALVRSQEKGIQYGVRFHSASDDPRHITAMEYVVQTDPWKEGTVDVIGDQDNKQRIVEGRGCAWWVLKRRGVLPAEVRIELPINSGNWYGADTSLIDLSKPPQHVERLVLDRAMGHKWLKGRGYQMTLIPTVDNESLPLLLPDGVVIDLDSSVAPTTWTVAPGNTRVGEIWFSPTGRMLNMAGKLNLYVCDHEDSRYLKSQYTGSQWGVPADEVNFSGTALTYMTGDRRAISIRPATSLVVIGRIYPVDADGDGFADDPFRIVEGG